MGVQMSIPVGLVEGFAWIVGTLSLDRDGVSSCTYFGSSFSGHCQDDDQFPTQKHPSTHETGQT
jgi:hypothetical protein